jgi:hypothetical protein
MDEAAYGDSVSAISSGTCGHIKQVVESAAEW